MVLGFKRIPFRSVDGLALAQLPHLQALSPRAEVPVLVDGDLVVCESADIVDYLEHTHPAPSVFPDHPAARVAARAWQRTADRVIDAIVHDMSLWLWPTHERDDSPPAGLAEHGHRDLTLIFDQLEIALGDRPFVCGDLSIADFALQPHMPSLRLVGFTLDPQHHARVCDWVKRMREIDVVRDDLENARAAVAERFGGTSPYEAHRVVWRGDRIEWLLGKGYDDWWSAERRSGRAVIPQSVAAAAS